MTSRLSKTLSFFTRMRRKLIIAVTIPIVVLLIYALSVSFILPRVIFSVAHDALKEQFNRELSVEKFTINPFYLNMTIEGLKLTERESEETFVAFDRLFVDVSVKTLYTFSPVIKEVTLTAPYMHLARTESGVYNISDILERLMEPSDPESEPFKYSVNNIRIDGGKIVFDDLPVNVQHQVEDLKLQLPFISTIPSRVERFIKPHLSARVNGTEMELSAKTRPFAEDRETTVNLTVNDIELAKYIGYLPYKPAFELADGTLNFDLNLHFVQPEDASSTLEVSGDVHARSLRVLGADKKTMLGFENLSVQLSRNSIFARDFRIEAIELVRPEVHVVNSSEGRLNLMDLAGPPGVRKVAAATKEKEDKGAPFNSLVLKSLNVQGARLGYSDFSLAVPVTVKADNLDISVENTMVDMSARKARIGRVGSGSAKLDMVMEKGGRGASSQKTASPDPVSSPAFVVEIAEVDFSGWSLHLQNNNIKKPIGLAISDLTARIQDISTAPDKISTVRLSAGVDRKGSVAVEGKVGIEPLSANVDLVLKNINIVAIQQYIDEYVNLTLRQADVSAKGHVSLAMDRQGKLKGGYKGDVSIANLVTTDQIKGDSFVNWKSFSLRQMDAGFSPLSLHIRRAELDNFFARLILSSTGRLNLQDILRSEAGGQKSLTDAEAHSGDGKDNKPESAQETTVAGAPDTGFDEMFQPVAAASAKPGTATAVVKPSQGIPFPVRIDHFSLTNGRIHFSDNFIRPSYSADLDKVQGVITRISSDVTEMAVLDLKGEVNHAPLTVSGSLTPFNFEHSLEIEAQVKNMDLPQFSSYSGKYVGYGIEKGKLSFEVKYKLAQGVLAAENRLVLDQLTFGEKVEGEPVISLPVQFAVSLLKDSDGVIDINLPISGSLNDPQFSVGGIIFKVVVNLIKKVVMAPFSALVSGLGGGSGGGEELSWIAFTPGKSDVTDKQAEKLATLSRALKGKQGLKLEITGSYNADLDREAMKRASIDKKVQALKLRKMQKEGDGKPVPLSQVTVSPQEYPALLKEVYRNEDFRKPRNLIGLQKSIPVDEMEKLMMENDVVKEEDFMALADRRAMNVKNWLIEKGGLLESQIVVRAGKSLTGENSTRVDFDLKH